MTKIKMNLISPNINNKMPSKFSFLISGILFSQACGFGTAVISFTMNICQLIVVVGTSSCQTARPRRSGPESRCVGTS